jgi:hypothetical protein
MQKLRRGPAYARAFLQELDEAGEIPGRHTDLQRIASTLNLEVREVDAQGFDGSLIRAKDLPLGAILVRQSIREASRKKFTIAHELGHFFLHGHDQIDGVCVSGDIGNWGGEAKALEREADEFAAELLMHGALVLPVIHSMSPSLQAIEKIAMLCGTSLSAAAWRFCDLTRERCAVVWSAAREIQWSKRSQYFGFRLTKGATLQPATFAFACFSGRNSGPEPLPVLAELWIGSKNLPEGAKVWEQSKALPSYGSVISLLWIKERRTALS